MPENKRRYVTRDEGVITDDELLGSVGQPEDWDDLTGIAPHRKATPDPITQTASDAAIARVFSGDVKKRKRDPDADARLREAILNGTFVPLDPEPPKKRPRIVPPKSD